MVKRKYKFIIAGLLVGTMLAGCSGGNSSATSTKGTDKAAESEETVFNYGTTAYGPEMGNAGLNPHDGYTGWSTIRYGVGETLFKFSEAMELEPWLATGYEQIDEYTVRIDLRDDVEFSSGRKMDGQAVKESLAHLIAVHDRAPLDTQIKEITADGQSITIVSEEMVPALLNFLSDPYGVIIDMSFGTDGVTSDRNVAGTGPYIAYEIADDHIYLEKNENYWGGEVKTDKVNVRTISDGDTLTMALQSGQIDATQGLPYASLPIFKNNSDYKISSISTSRAFFGAMNYETPALQDINVRKAISMGIDKAGFTNVLLNGNGTSAVGAFPSSFTFGSDQVTAPEYDPEEAKVLLEQSGWTDTDGDGYVDKDGKKLTLRWLTYPGRQELPLLAESAQETLKAIGIAVEVNSTANHLEILPTGQWDIYVSAFVTAPTGDPAYFFTTHALKESAKNRGKYYNEELEKLAVSLASEFDKEKRSAIAIQMQQLILDDSAFVFASHLKMSFVMKKNIEGFESHPSDYYEITANLDVK